MVQTENKWERIDQSGEGDRLYSKPRSFAEDVWFRFSHKPTSLLGLIIIVFLLLFAVIGPYLTPYGYDDQNTKLANIPPIMQVFPAPAEHRNFAVKIRNSSFFSGILGTSSAGILFTLLTAYRPGFFRHARLL